MRTGDWSQRRPAADYASCLGISAAAWQGSTDLSLRQVFGNAGGLQLSPTAGPVWSAALLGTRAHFINFGTSLPPPSWS